MAAGGNLGKLVLIGAIAFGAWFVYDRYYSPPGIVQEADNLLLAGHYREAADLYEEAAWQDPDNLHLQLKLGECYFYLGQKGLAAMHYRNAEPLLNSGVASVGLRRHQDRYETLRSQGF